MAGISIQFHALPEELLPWLEEARTELKLHVAAIGLHPFHVDVVGAGELPQVIVNERVRRIALTLASPRLPASSPILFRDLNPDALLLEIGRATSLGLKESWLTVRAPGEEAYRCWAWVARQLRQATRAGAVAVNLSTGEKSVLEAHRYTEGARRLAAQGVPMLPAAGASRIEFIQRC